MGWLSLDYSFERFLAFFLFVFLCRSCRHFSICFLSCLFPTAVSPGEFGTMAKLLTLNAKSLVFSLYLAIYNCRKSLAAHSRKKLIMSKRLWKFVYVQLGGRNRGLQFQRYITEIFKISSFSLMTEFFLILVRYGGPLYCRGDILCYFVNVMHVNLRWMMD